LSAIKDNYKKTIYLDVSGKQLFHVDIVVIATKGVDGSATEIQPDEKNEKLMKHRKMIKIEV
jgi:hypothetical protein